MPAAAQLSSLAPSLTAAAPLTTPFATDAPKQVPASDAPLPQSKPGVLLTQLPPRDRAAAYTTNERGARWSAAEQWKFDAPNADRWMDLERMRLNILKAVGVDKPDKLGSYVNALQGRLITASQSLADSKDRLASLEHGSSWWAHVPLSGENTALNEARATVQSKMARLKGVGAEIDKLLNKWDSIYYLRPIDPAKDGDSTGYFAPFDYP
jgi:hypothetical protein